MVGNYSAGHVFSGTKKETARSLDRRYKLAVGWKVEYIVTGTRRMMVGHEEMSFQDSARGAQPFRLYGYRVTYVIVTSD